MHTVEHILEINYRKCPLKKRPVNYQFEDTTDEPKDQREPENLSLRKESEKIVVVVSEKSIKTTTTTTTATSSPTSIPIKRINNEEEHSINMMNDCCEDEGVELDQNTDYDDNEDDEEEIDCVDIEQNSNSNQTQAAALAAVAAAAVVVPTPTYPWNFHISQYTAEFYRTINNPQLVQQISPLHSDLLSPSSPADSIGSLSPPPHYLHGRPSSVSPPIRSEIIHRPIGVRQTTVTHRFMPYALPAFHPHHHPHHHHHHQQTVYPLTANYPSQQHAPISPAYSESSYYSMRSLTPESNCSISLPEDLSLKHTTSITTTTTTTTNNITAKTNNNNNNINMLPIKTELESQIIINTSNGNVGGGGSTHKKEKTGPPRYQCPDCQKSYSTFSGLTKHQQFHCPAAEGNQVKKCFSCKDCDKTYVSLGALKMHIRTHTLPCKCNICGKAFSRPWLLQGHIRTHTGEKPFSCPHCHRAFADRSNLRAHLQTHSDIKKYSCTNCSKTFSRMSLLTKHSEGGCPGGNGISVFPTEH